MPEISKNTVFKICTALLLLFVISNIIGGIIGVHLLTIPKNRNITDNPVIANISPEIISLESEDGVQLAGSYYKGNRNTGVVFAHGLGSSRNGGIKHAGLYLERGYGVLLLDERGHGESEATRVTVGWKERYDLLAACAFMEQRGYTSIGLHGISMGAAAIVMLQETRNDFGFLILESSYDTFENAIANRLEMVGAPNFFSYSFRMLVPFVTGASLGKMSPRDYMQFIKAPTLILAGDSEPEVHIDETRSLFDAYTAENCTLVFFEGARHQGLLGYDKQKYIATFNAFLDSVENKGTNTANAVALVN